MPLAGRPPRPPRAGTRQGPPQARYAPCLVARLPVTAPCPIAFSVFAGHAATPNGVEGVIRWEFEVRERRFAAGKTTSVPYYCDSRLIGSNSPQSDNFRGLWMLVRRRTSALIMERFPLLRNRNP